MIHGLPNAGLGALPTIPYRNVSVTADWLCHALVSRNGPLPRTALERSNTRSSHSATAPYWCSRFRTSLLKSWSRIPTRSGASRRKPATLSWRTWKRISRGRRPAARTSFSMSGVDLTVAKAMRAGTLKVTSGCSERTIRARVSLWPSAILRGDRSQARGPTCSLSRSRLWFRLRLEWRSGSRGRRKDWLLRGSAFPRCGARRGPRTQQTSRCRMSEASRAPPRPG
jgi:hypothetical protein